MHARGVIVSRPVGQQANPAVGLHQPHRFTRRVQPRLHLWAHRHPVDELSQRFHQERIPFVAAIKTHRLAEQTGRDPETDAFVGHRRVTPFDRAASEQPINRGEVLVMVDTYRSNISMLTTLSNRPVSSR